MFGLLVHQQVKEGQYLNQVNIQSQIKMAAKKYLTFRMSSFSYICGSVLEIPYHLLH